LGAQGNRYAAPVPNAPAFNGRAAGGRQGTRALVIGCGFIGSNVVAELASRGLPPVVLTRSRPADAVTASIDPRDLHIGEAAEPAELEGVLEGVGEVVYAAGGLLPEASEKDPERDAELTLAPLRATLDALESRRGARLTYVSSGGTVYGDPERLPVPETAPTHPRGAYGRLHLACEEEIARRRSERGLQARILRCATVYGEYQRPDRGQGAVVTFLHRIEHGEKIRLFGGESTIRDYVYAGDVAGAIADLLGRADAPPILNVGSGRGTSLLELLRLAERQVGRKAKVERLPERDFDVHEIVLDIGQLRRAVDFEPTPLPDGIASVHRWLTHAAHERV
jgi:UDP-glucose 4-epimerase